MRNNLITFVLAATLLGVSLQVHADIPDTVRADKLKIGKKSSAANKVIEFDTGAGSANPKIQANKTNSKLEFAKDGVNFKELGSGSGGGGGINLLTSDENPGFEDGTTAWTSSGGSFTSTSVNPLYGETSSVWDASASGQTLSSGSKAIKEGLKDKSCLAGISYKYSGSDGDYKLQVYDGTSVLSEISLNAASSATDAYVGFTCPSSGSVRLRLYSNVANPGAITIDGTSQNGGLAQLGSNILLANYSAASFYGSLTYVGAASCQWDFASPYVDAPADTDCSVPTVTGSVTAPSTKVIQAKIDNAPAAAYQVAFQGSHGSTTGGTCRIVDENGTVLDQRFVINQPNYATGFTLIGTVSYSTAGNHTFKAQCSDGNIEGYRDNTSFKIWKFPTSAQTTIATTSDTAKQGEYYLTGCSVSPASTSGSYADFDSPSGCTLSYVKGTLTGATLGSQGAASISIPASKAGQTFEVCATGSNGSGGGAAYVQIVDNQGTAGESQFNPTGSIVPFRVCTHATSTAVGNMTVKLQGAIGSGTGSTIQGPGVGPRFMTWTIKDVSSSFPMVYLTKQLQSTSTANMLHATAKIDCSAGTNPCTIVRQDGSWISSVTWVTTGVYTVNMSGFSSTPNCQCTARHQSTVAQYSCDILEEYGASSSQLGISFTNLSGSGANWMFYLTCDGPK
jgi:hypothetical protein